MSNLVLEDNPFLTDLDNDAFLGLSNTTYLRANRNSLKALPEEWGGDLFAPFRSLSVLRCARGKSIYTKNDRIDIHLLLGSSCWRTTT